MQVCVSVCESFWVPQLTRSPNACELQSLQSLLLCVFSQIDIVPHCAQATAYDRPFFSTQAIQIYNTPQAAYSVYGRLEIQPAL